MNDDEILDILRDDHDAAPQSVTFDCPLCSTSITASAQQAGERVKCSHCQLQVAVPCPATNAPPSDLDRLARAVRHTETSPATFTEHSSDDQPDPATTQRAISLRCPNCDYAFAVPSSWLAESIICDRCGFQRPAKRFLQHHLSSAAEEKQHLATARQEQTTILILGEPSAGKTVYLSVLYHHLWHGWNGITMRAGTGTMHSELLRSVAELANGNPPAATAALHHYEFEIERGDVTYHLRYLDYPGELFQKVFHNLVLDTDEARELYSYCENAGGVLVLIDPASAVARSAEVDYALSNLIRYCRAGRDTEFVIAFTKRDQTEKLVAEYRSLGRFLRKTMPHSYRELSEAARIMHFCSFRRKNDAMVLAQPHTVAAPLIAVLDCVEKRTLARHRRTRRDVRSWLATVKLAGTVILVFSLTVLAFLAGVLIRHYLEFSG